MSCTLMLCSALFHTYRKNSKVQKRGKINLIGRLQLTTERMREEENEGIVQLRILRTQVLWWAHSMTVLRLLLCNTTYCEQMLSSQQFSSFTWADVGGFVSFVKVTGYGKIPRFTFVLNLPPAGGHNTDHEDEETHQQRPAADGARGDPEEHVFTTEEDDQGADRVVDRSQVHQAGRDWYKHLHLHGVAQTPGGWCWLWFKWIRPDGL